MCVMDDKQTVTEIPTDAPVESRGLRRSNLFQLFPFLMSPVVVLSACSEEPVAAPAEVTSIEAREGGGSILEITVTNPLKSSSDATCTVAARGPGNSFTVKVGGIAPSGQETVRTNLPELNPETDAEDIKLACEVSP